MRTLDLIRKEKSSGGGARNWLSVSAAYRQFVEAVITSPDVSRLDHGLQFSVLPSTSEIGGKELEREGIGREERGWPCENICSHG